MAPTEAHAPLLLARAARVLVSYAPEDEPLCEKLAQHLALLQRRGLVELWDQRALLAGESAEAAAAAALDRADLVLLLVSAAFHASDLWERDLEPALARERAGATRVIPILARPADFDHPVLAERAVLPRSRVPITAHEDPEAAWAEVADEIGAMLEPARPSDPAGPDAAAVELLDRVERVCRLNEPGAEIARKKAPPPFGPYLEITKKERGRVKIFPVGALLDTPSNQTLDTFVKAIDARYRAGQARLESVLVHQGPRAPQSLVDAAYDRGVVVQTFEEYTGGLDFSQYVARQLSEVRSNRIYPPELYIPQRARVLVGRAESEVPSVLDELAALLRSPDPQFLVVLADFGTGKTFLLRKLFLSLAGTKIVPIRVEMRALDKAQSLDGMLAAHFMQSGERAYDRERFRYMLEEGDIALMFDGFDELALRVSYDRAGDHLETLIEAAQGRAKVVLTSRSQHFLSDAQAKEAIEKAKTKLANRVDHLPGARFVKLLPFNEQEILAFLNNKLREPQEAQERFELIRDVKDLLGLSHNPRMLSFIAEVPEDELREAKARRGDVTAATLYELILQQWLGYEIGRANPRGAPAGLDEKDTWRALVHFAEHLWSGTEKALDVTKLAPELERAVSSLGPSDMPGDQKVFAVASGSLLVRDEEGRFSFVHRSVLEFLVAWTAACQLRAGRRDIPLLSARAMSELMADFFADEAGRPIAEEWAQGMLAGEAPEIAKKNADLVLRRMGASARSRASFKNADLRGQDFTGRSLKWADFSGADLSHAKLVGADLSDAVLTGARLADADLSQADLARADLSFTDLSRARMLACDTRGARWNGSLLYRTMLAGSALDPAAVAQARLQVGAVIPPITAPTPHHEPVMWEAAALAIRADILATAHEDGSVHVWDLGSGLHLRVFNKYSGRVRSIAISADVGFLVVGSADGTIRLWSLSSGALLHQMTEHQAAVTGVAIHPDGRTLASCSRDGVIRLWDMAMRAGRQIGNTHAELTSLAWSPDGNTLVSTGKSELVHLWNPWSGEYAHPQDPALRGATKVAFSPDGSTMAFGHPSGSVLLVDGRSKLVTRTLRGHETSVTALAWSPEGSTLATADELGILLFWSTSTWELQPRRILGRAITSIAFTSDGHQVVSAGRESAIRLWSTTTGRTRSLESWASPVNAVRFDPRGKALATASHDLPLRLFDPLVLRLLRRIDEPGGRVLGMEYSPNGQAIAVCGGGASFALVDPSTGALLRTFEGHQRQVTSVAWSPDGGMLASVSADQSVRMWNAYTGKELSTLDEHPEALTCAGWSSTGTWLAWGSVDGGLWLSNEGARRSVQRLPSHDGKVTAVVFDHAGEVLVSASADATIRGWSAPRGYLLSTLMGHHGKVTCLAIDRASGTLASGSADNTVRLWEMPSGQRIAALEGHGGGVTSVAFHPSGRLLAAGCGDGSIHLWRAQDAVRLAVLYQSKYGWVAYTPNGRYKLGGDIDRAFWHVVGLCRFEAGELDPYVPGLRKADEEPLFTLDP